jgi:protein SCO1/2
MTPALPRTITILCICLSVLALMPVGRAHAVSFETQASQEAVLKEIGVDEHPGAAVPRELVFTDQEGKPVRLGDYFTGKPVLLTLNYYECPMLCPVTFANLAKTMRGMRGLAPGRDFRIVTVSINPDETAGQARDISAQTYAMLPKSPDPPLWWSFLFGYEKEITALTNAVGFRYKQIARNNFAHPSAIIVLTPEGKVSRYLYGIEQDPSDLKLALVEASGGKIGSSAALNQVLLFCYHYDPVGKKYQLAALNIMKAAGVLIVAGLGALFLVMWRHERGRRGLD